VVKHVEAAEVRIVVAAVLVVAADAVFVGHHLPKLLPIWLPQGRLKKQPGGRKHAGEIARIGGAETLPSR
jgi:hypothetical protein